MIGLPARADRSLTLEVELYQRALADILPPVRLGNGMLFGAGLWLVADELMLWKLGLAKKPTEFPTATHAHALASHLVYGLTLETVRRLVRRLS